MNRPTRSATEAVGVRLVTALADGDRDSLIRLFATPVEFRAVTPRRFWDAETPVQVADIVLGTWFDASKKVTDICLVEDDAVGDVSKVSYRLLVATDAGPTVIEQVAYYTCQDGLITHFRLLCSGFRPV